MKKIIDSVMTIGWIIVAILALSLASILGVIAASMVAITLPFFLLTVLYVFIFRGHKRIKFMWPSECTSFESWMMHEWYYISKGEDQSGWRMLGIECALKGDII